MKTCVVIPTYNEHKTIASLIRGVRGQNLQAVVVDDGSYDDTAQIAKEEEAIVLRNQNNQGKGASLIKGFNYALGQNFDAVITIDGDGQHLPEDIPFFLRLAKNSKSAIFVGNRMQKTKNMPLPRLLTNRIMSWVISRIIKQDIPDTQCGFRLIKKELLEKIKFSTFKYETESEILIQAGRKGFKIESVPIKTIYQGEKSQINPFIDSIRFLRFIIKELWITPH
jgi:glycosyltransferase involved in cell wall biosynthesis